jgi:mevalonyl-CoA ligase
MATRMSLVTGSKDSPLMTMTLGQLCQLQAKRHPNKAAVIVAWTGARLSYADIDEYSIRLAKGLVKLGARRGSRIAIFSGDDEKFIILFFAAARIAACLVIFNKTWTAEECERAVRHIGACFSMSIDQSRRVPGF